MFCCKFRKTYRVLCLVSLVCIFPGIGLAQTASTELPPVEGAELRPLWKFSQADFILDIRALGDINGDGISEYFILGSGDTEQRRSVFDGATQRSLFDIPLMEWDEHRDVVLVVVPDQTGDGYSELLAADCAKEPQGGLPNDGVFILISGSNGAILWQEVGGRGAFLGHKELACDVALLDNSKAGLGSQLIVSSRVEGSEELVYHFLDLSSQSVRRSWLSLSDFAIGMQIIRDVSGDGRDDFILRADTFRSLHVVANEPQPRVLNSLGLDEAIVEFVPIRDVNDDRVFDVVMLTPSGVRVVSGQTGEMIWRRIIDDPSYLASSIIRSAGDFNHDSIEDVLFIENSFRGRGQTFIGRVQILSGREGAILYERQGSREQGIDLGGVAGPAAFTHSGAPLDLLFLTHQGQFANRRSALELYDHVAISSLPSIFGVGCYEQGAPTARPPRFRNVIPDYRERTLTILLDGEPNMDAYLLVGFETLPERYEIPSRPECVVYTGPRYGVLPVVFDAHGLGELRIDIPQTLAQEAAFAVFQVIAEDNRGNVALGDAAVQIPIHSFFIAQ